MYSVLPTVVSALFLGCGLYVIAQKGIDRISARFFLVCLIAACWQAMGAVLFQLRDPAWLDVLARVGSLPLLFLPTSLYQLLAEIAQRPQERPWVSLSHAFAAGLALLVASSDLVVAGYRNNGWGAYPQAGPLYVLLILLTVVVVTRGLFILWRARQRAAPEQRGRLRLGVVGGGVFLLVGLDFLGSYGLALYPPGGLFAAIGLGLIAVAITRRDAPAPMTIAAAMTASIAHEMRASLASIRLQAEVLARLLPQLYRSDELTLVHGLKERGMEGMDAARLTALYRGITHQVDRSNVAIDTMLACARMDQIETAVFTRHAMAHCVRRALDTYPFTAVDRNRVNVSLAQDFEFLGSSAQMTYVLFNLIKNALYAIRAAGKGRITISLAVGPEEGTLIFKDTGSGMAADTLARIFEPFFTTKAPQGAGLGLTFCRRAVESFGGQMACVSIEGKHTTFTMRFPLLAPQHQPASRTAPGRLHETAW